MELAIRKPRKSFDENGVQFAWDATSISAFQTCPRYYQYSIIEGWRSNLESEHLRFGKHFAAALEHYYKLVAAGMDWLEALEAIVAEALLATWDRPQVETDVAVYEPGSGSPWVSTHNTKNRENLIRSIVWYIDEFHEADNLKTKILSDGSPAVEHSFKLPVDNGIIFTGHIDRVAELDGDPFVTDNKTTQSTITPYWFAQFKPHTQFSMYTFAGKAIFQLPIKGVVIDAAQIAVGFTRFARATSFRTDGELDEWYDDSMYWIAQAQRATIDNFFPMNPASCGNYGGCRYREVCSKSPGLRENFLKASFHQNDPWDPIVAR